MFAWSKALIVLTAATAMILPASAQVIEVITAHPCEATIVQGANQRSLPSCRVDVFASGMPNDPYNLDIRLGGANERDRRTIRLTVVPAYFEHGFVHKLQVPPINFDGLDSVLRSKTSAIQTAEDHFATEEDVQTAWFSAFYADRGIRLIDANDPRVVRSYRPRLVDLQHAACSYLLKKPGAVALAGPSMLRRRLDACPADAVSDAEIESALRANFENLSARITQITGRSSIAELERYQGGIDFAREVQNTIQLQALTQTSIEDLVSQSGLIQEALAHRR